MWLKTFTCGVTLLFLPLVLFSFPILAFAQLNGGPGTGGGGINGGPGTGAPSVQLINPLSGVNCGSNGSGNSSCLMAFLNNILGVVIKIGTIVVIVMLVYTGYKFVVAQGAPGAIEEAKQMLLWTLVGALILLGAQAISAGISATVQALGS